MGFNVLGSGTWEPKFEGSISLIALFSPWINSLLWVIPSEGNPFICWIKTHILFHLTDSSGVTKSHIFWSPTSSVLVLKVQFIYLLDNLLTWNLIGIEAYRLHSILVTLITIYVSLYIFPIGLFPLLLINKQTKLLIVNTNYSFKLKLILFLLIRYLSIL